VIKRGLIVFLLLSAALTGCIGSTRQKVEKLSFPQNPPQTSQSSLPAESSEEPSLDVPPPEPSSPTREAVAPHSAEIEAPTGDLVEIKEKVFIAQTNDIYLNPEEYLGKTIKYQGIYKNLTLEETGETIHYVIRYGPGCCGYDGEAGFEVAWAGGWPQVDDWCEVVGVLEIYEHNGMRYLRVALDSLIVLEERGAEYVTQ